LSEHTKVFQSSGASILGKEKVTKNKQKEEGGGGGGVGKATAQKSNVACHYSAIKEVNGKEKKNM
jgi:hypothetical protein